MSTDASDDSTATGRIDWAQRIQAARAARVAATRAEEQTIQDASEDDFPIAHIAAALGQRNRNRIYDVLRRDRGGVLTNPAPTPLIYLRGAGRKDTTWKEVEHAMWVRGWRTTSARTEAWHAARSGVPTVLADFTAGLDYPRPGCVHVALVRAVYGDDGALRLPVISSSAPNAPKVADLPGRIAMLVRQALDGLLTAPTVEREA